MTIVSARALATPARLPRWVLTIRRQIRRAIRRRRSRAKAIGRISQWQFRENGFSREAARSM
jgi:hypothetical protein